MNPNSVNVSMIQTGCWKSEFDSTYPIHLNGIIGQSEFQESIKKINRSSFSREAIIAVLIIYFLSVLISTLCMIFGAVNAADSQTYGFTPLMTFGLVLLCVGLVVFIIVFVMIKIRQTARLRQAIAEESMKYSARSPTPCSWRLETTTFYGEDFSFHVVYRLIIDIGRETVASSGGYYSNQNANESSHLIGEHSQYAPPSYFGSSTASCSKCGATRSDISARFCSSCGQAFNKF